MDNETNTKNVDAFYINLPQPVGRIKLCHRGSALLELAILRAVNLLSQASNIYMYIISLVRERIIIAYQSLF